MRLSGVWDANCCLESRESHEPTVVPRNSHKCLHVPYIRTKKFSFACNPCQEDVLNLLREA